MGKNVALNDAEKWYFIAGVYTCCSKTKYVVFAAVSACFIL